MSTHVTRPRTSLCFVKISGFHVKLSTRNRVHSPANSLSRCTPSSHRAGGESCSAPHHPMRVNLPIVICTTTGMSKITFQKSSFLKTRQITALTGIKGKRKIGKWVLRARNKRNRTGAPCSLPFPIPFLVVQSASVQGYFSYLKPAPKT